MKYPWHTCIALSAIIAVLSSSGSSAEKKKYKTISNELALEMLDTVQADVKQHYYDPAMHGLDLDARFAKAKQEIQSAKSQDEALLDIAGAVAALRDSHTRFGPPIRPYSVDYGWVHQSMGDACCFVTAVRSNSDAAQKGMKAGDQIMSINGIKVTRDDIGYVDYSYSVFPQSGLHLSVRSPQGVEREMVAMAKVIPGQEIIRGQDFREWLRAYHGEKGRSRYHAIGDRVMVWQLPDFLIDPNEVDGLFNKVRPYETLILDLRRNPGGLEAAMSKFVSNLFENEVEIGNRKGRNETTSFAAKPRGGKAYKGKVIILVDSRSASASEILARVIQIEKRGIVIGDRSAGAVGEAQVYVHALKLDATNVTQYRTEITVRELVMKDGASLENTGVAPDERVVPTADDLAAGRDPVLARALQLTGVEMSAEEAGKILPFVWPKEQMPEIN